MASNPASAGQPGAATIIAALLLPPLAVYLMQGLSPSFWTSVALTCLGIVPGIVFAVIAVFATHRRQEGRVASVA